MKHETLFITFLIFLSSTGLGLDFSIQESCGNREPIFSMNSKTDSSIGMPGYYKWQVCGEEVEYSEYRTECRDDENVLASSFEKNDSHISVYDSYNWKICSPRIQTSVNETCENSIVSIHSEDDSHVAEPGHYNKQLCAEFDEPENVTVELSLDSAENVYIDGEDAEERTYNPTELSYPYAVSEKTGLIGYGQNTHLEYSNSSGEVLKATQTQGSFLLPLTRDIPNSVENRRDEVTEREFMELTSPSFNYAISEKPLVKVAYQNQRLENSAGEIYTSGEFAVRNENRSDGRKVVLHD